MPTTTTKTIPDYEARRVRKWGIGYEIYPGSIHFFIRVPWCIFLFDFRAADF